ncbi:MAG: hypothetical protein LBV03_02620 [Fusobacteriales bacterium]|nr:hypothetical protein [Fusobacteriales bacterium]
MTFDAISFKASKELVPIVLAMLKRKWGEKLKYKHKNGWIKEAIQVTGNNHEEIESFVLNGTERVYLNEAGKLVDYKSDIVGYLVKSLTNTKRLAKLGDYIIKYRDDYYAPCTLEIFEKEFKKAL